MHPKAGVDLSTLRPEIRRLEPLIDAAHAELGIGAVATSTNQDGYDAQGRPIHRSGSLHYRDLAVDLRSKHAGGRKRQELLYSLLARAIAQAYPGQYDVLFERHAYAACPRCGRIASGTPEAMARVALAHSVGAHRAEVWDLSHFHIEPSPRLMALIDAAEAAKKGVA